MIPARGEVLPQFGERLILGHGGCSGRATLAAIVTGLRWRLRLIGRVADRLCPIDGVRAVDPVLKMVVRAYRMPLPTRVALVTLPAASPRILSGMQVSLVTAFIVMIASEMLGSSSGLGAATLLAQQSFAIADMWAGILLLGVIGYATSALFGLLRRGVLRWYIAAQQMGREL